MISGRYKYPLFDTASFLIFTPGMRLKSEILPYQIKGVSYKLLHSASDVHSPITNPPTGKACWLGDFFSIPNWDVSAQDVLIYSTYIIRCDILVGVMLLNVRRMGDCPANV